MAWNVLSIVFKKEFDSTAGEEAASRSMQMFFDAYKAEMVDCAPDYEHLASRLSQLETPLRAAYVLNCMMAKTKPNSGVMQLLNDLPFERDVETFSLGNNLVGDSRLLPLIPLFARMYRLQSLDLSNNGLKNRSVRALCEVLMHHKTICRLDLSGNPLTRESGKGLLQLVTALPHLRTVRLENTQIETALKERVEQRAMLNREVQK